MNLNELIEERKILIEKEKKLYLNQINQINTQMSELLDNDLGVELVKSCTRDLSGEVVRRFFNTSSLYITVDQLAKRIIEFNYDNEYDPLGENSDYQKNVYNYTESSFKDKNGDFISKELNNISTRNEKNMDKVFEKRDKSEPYYDDNNKKWSTRSAYKKLGRDPGSEVTNDDLSNKDVRKETLAGDHVRPVNTAMMNSSYLGEEYRNKMEQVYNSHENMQWIDSRANSSKGDASTPQETIKKWENTPSEDLRNHLKDIGYLNEDGKVPKHIKKQLEYNEKKIGNKESIEAIKHSNKSKIAKDAAKDTVGNIKNIVAGQLIYYSLPCIVYESKIILKKKVTSVDSFLNEFKKSSKRIEGYLHSKISQILKNIGLNTTKQFIKGFFDILVSLLKETVRRVVKIIKDLVLAVVDSIKVVLDKNKSRAEKADAVFNLVSVTITTCVLEVLFELVEKQVPIPGFIMEVLQIIITVITTNIVIIKLNELDIFNLKYGIMVGKIEEIYTNANIEYINQLKLEEEKYFEKEENIINYIKREIKDIKERISDVDIYSEFATNDLNIVSNIFDMGIDFEDEWVKFMGLA